MCWRYAGAATVAALAAAASPHRPRPPPRSPQPVAVPHSLSIRAVLPVCVTLCNVTDVPLRLRLEVVVAVERAGQWWRQDVRSSVVAWEGTLTPAAAEVRPSVRHSARRRRTSHVLRPRVPGAAWRLALPPVCCVSAGAWLVVRGRSVLGARGRALVGAPAAAAGCHGGGDGCGGAPRVLCVTAAAARVGARTAWVDCALAHIHALASTRNSQVTH